MTADWRLAAPVAVAWVVIATALTAPGLLALATAIAWGAAAVAILVSIALRRRPAGPKAGGRMLTLGISASIALVLAAVLLGSASVRSEERRPPAVLEAASSGRSVVMEATTTQAVAAGSDSFTVTVDQITIGTRSDSMALPARVFGEPAPVRWAIGSSITVRGTLEMTEPGDAIAVLVFTEREPELTGSPAAGLAWADALRAGLTASAQRLPGDGGSLLPGLAIGDTSGVPADLDDAMTAASLSHLTAVSGANCAVVVGLVMLTGGAIGVPRGIRIVASLLMLAGFVVLVTPQPSVLRAAVMVGVVLVATARGRPSRGIPVLAVAVIVLLAIDPWLARQYGFILSVLATGGLLLLARPIASWGSRWMPRPVASALAIPIAAQLACQPVLILLSPTVSIFGVVANILAAPAAPVATVVGLAACVLLAVAPPVGLVATSAAWAPSAWIAAVARFVSGIPWGSIPWREGLTGVVAIAALSALLLLALLSGSTLLRRVSRATLAVVLVIGIGASVGSGVRSAITRPAHWQYAACDVGQGDAMLIKNADATALVDTGADPALLTACLEHLGIERIDLLVLTHFDLDHVGGIEAVLGRVDVALVGPSGGPDDDALVREVGEAGAEMVRVAAGSTGRLGDLRWTVLWPPEPLRGVEPGNDASIAMRFDGVGDCASGCLSALFLGDLGERSQERMLATTRASEVDVVKVAHHGSADQAPRLYSAISATVALIGVGADNTYGHPTDELIDLLASSGTTPTRTDTDGMVLLAPGETGAVRVWTERGG